MSMMPKQIAIGDLYVRPGFEKNIYVVLGSWKHRSGQTYFRLYDLTRFKFVGNFVTLTSFELL